MPLSPEEEEAIRREFEASRKSGHEEKAADQGLSTISSALSSRLGKVARDAAAVGASIVRSRSGEVTVTVPAGYTFYIIEEKRQQ